MIFNLKKCKKKGKHMENQKAQLQNSKKRKQNTWEKKERQKGE